MVLVYTESGNVQTAMLAGDPTKPVLAKASPTATPLKPVGKIVGLTIGPRGDLIFAAAPVEAANDLGLYCYCDGLVNRITSPDDFLPITTAGPGKPILSLTSDGQQAAAFIAPSLGGDNTAIFVTAVQ